MSNRKKTPAARTAQMRRNAQATLDLLPEEKTPEKHNRAVKRYNKSLKLAEALKDRQMRAIFNNTSKEN